MKLATRIILLFLIISLSLMTLTACSNVDTKETKVATKEKQVEKEVASIPAFGVVKVRELKRIQLDVPATITRVHVSKGERVSRGDLLLSLDLREPQDQLEEVKSSLQVAQKELDNIENIYQVNLKKLQSNLSIAEEVYIQKQEDLAQKKEELTKQDSPKYRRLNNRFKSAKKLKNQLRKELLVKEKLLQQEVISEFEYEQEQKKYDLEEEKVRDLELAIKEFNYNQQEKIEELELALKQQKNNINNLKLAIEEEKHHYKQKYLAQQDKIIRLNNEIKNLEYKLYSRNYLKEEEVVLDINNGVVKAVNCANGDVVTKTTEAITLLSIMDLSDVIIEADVPEEFIKDVSIGSRADIVPLANPKKKYHGRVTRIYNLAVNNGGETIIPIEISITDLDQFLLPNFNVDVEIKKN